MNLLLISLHYYRQKTNISFDDNLTPDVLPVNSLSLMQLAGLTLDNYDITALDHPKKINFDAGYDLIGISTVTASVP